jgi:hypothetical protein
MVDIVENADKGPALLPVWTTVGASYRLAWENRGQYLKASWLWLSLLAPLMVLYALYAWDDLKQTVCAVPSRHADVAAPEPSMTTALVYSFPVSCIELLAVASIAVAWHRLILRNERVTAAHYFRLDSPVWNYFAVGFAFYVVSSAPLALLSDMGDKLHLLADVMMMFCTVIILRLSVILPARALEAGQVTMKAVWQRTSWNFWRIFWGYMLSAAASIPFSLLLFAGCHVAAAGPWLLAASRLLNVVLVVPPMLTFLSLTYRHFFGSEIKA